LAFSEPRLLEHEAARWLGRDELDTVNWLPADVKVAGAVKDKVFAGRVNRH